MIAALKRAWRWLWAHRWYVLTLGLGAAAAWLWQHHGRPLLPDRRPVDAAERAARQAEAEARATEREEATRETRLREALERRLADAAAHPGGRARLGADLTEPR